MHGVKVFFAVCMVCCFNKLSAQMYDYDEMLERNAVEIRQRMSAYRKLMFPLADDLFTNAISKTAERYFPLKAESELCRNHSKYLLDHVLQGDIWALRIVDASSKLQPAILDGHLQDLGNYDQCIKLSVPNPAFKGQHCVLNTRGIVTSELQNRLGNWSKNLNVMFSLCVPSTCSTKDIMTHVNLNLASINASTTPFTGWGSPNDTDDWPPNFITCSDGEFPYRTKDFVAMFVFAAIIFIALAGTLLESKSEILGQFSLIRNFNQLVDTKMQDGEIACLNGIRFLFIIVLAYIQRLQERIILPNNRYRTLLELYSRHDLQSFVEVGELIVDGFFLLSGIVVSYTFILRRQKDASYRLFFFYVRRYLRLTPLLAVVMLFSDTLLVHCSRGPLWYLSTGVEEYKCDRFWKSGLLHTSTLVAPDTVCVDSSWYIATLYQLTILSPIFLIQLEKRPRIGLILIAVCSLASIAYYIFHFHINEVSLGFFTAKIFQDRTADSNDERIFTLRAPGFLIGMALGYFILVIRQDETCFKVKKFFYLVGWLLSLGPLIGVSVVAGILAHPDHRFHPWIDPLFKATYRPLFCASLAWVVFACSFGYGGNLNQFLSTPAFRPLARLTFSFYLSHRIFGQIQQDSLKVADVYSLVDELYLLCGELAFSFSLAALLYMTVELPFAKIVDILFKGKKKPSESTDSFQLDKITSAREEPVVKQQ